MTLLVSLCPCFFGRQRQPLEAAGLGLLADRRQGGAGRRIAGPALDFAEGEPGFEAGGGEPEARGVVDRPPELPERLGGIPSRPLRSSPTGRRR